jgi:hypothetical protein
VADRVGADLARDLDLALGDQRPRDRGAEQILALIDGVRPEHREDIIADELLAQVVDEDVLGLDPEQLRLAARRLHLLALAEIGGEGDDLRPIFGLQPFEDDRGVEPARISEHDLLRPHDQQPAGGLDPDHPFAQDPLEPARAPVGGGELVG